MNQINDDDKAKIRTMENIADLITDICDQSTEKKDMNDKCVKGFTSRSIPNINIKEYLRRVIKYTQLGTSTLIIILVYIDRLCDMNKVRLNYFNIHKLILAAMILAIKYNEDDYYPCDFYAKVGGISIEEMTKIEYDFLILIDFRLFVEKDMFDKYSTYLKSFDDNKE